MSVKIDDLMKNNQAWVAEKLKLDEQYFDKLSEGQSPQVLYIGCSDSRVTAENIIGAKPGDLFVHRNIANMVVDGDINCMCVIRYAVAHLKVKHIIVVGHYHCGGIEAAMAPGDLGVLNPWLVNVRNVYRLHREELDAIEDPHVRNGRLVELNVIEQCINITKTATFQEGRKEYGVELHAWVFDIHTGKIIDLEYDIEKKWREIEPLYRII